MTNLIVRLVLALTTLTGGAHAWMNNDPAPVACTQDATEDGRLIDCKTGDPLEFDNGNWHVRR